MNASECSRTNYDRNQSDFKGLATVDQAEDDWNEVEGVWSEGLPSASPTSKDWRQAWRRNERQRGEANKL